MRDAFARIRGPIMRLLVICASAIVGVGMTACGSVSMAGGSGSGGGDGGVAAIDAGSASDGGSGTSGSDAGTANAGDGGETGSGGTGGSDAGGAGGGGSGDNGGASDAGTTVSDCDGLMPAAPGNPSQFVWEKQDLVQGGCYIGDVDGTGHLALLWQNAFQAHDSRYVFIDPSSGAAAGSFFGTRLNLIGQASGFIGSDCQGASCFQDYVVVGPTGKQLYKTPVDGTSPWTQANDPTGGMIHPRTRNDASGVVVLLDAIDPSGAIRWTRQLSAVFSTELTQPSVTLSVDRKGNVLALWTHYLGNTVSGQWFDHDGTPGAVFQAMTGTLPAFFERVGDGLLVYGYRPGSQFGGWIGQFEPLATSMSDPPAWLASRTTDSGLHMVHDGRGYAVLPIPGTSTACEQSIDVISPSGQFCGTAKFSVGGGYCTTFGMLVGYDGTVVQQLPRERESECGAAGHICNCTYRYWPGYFQ
jgi:hypothetical protein